MVEQATKGEAFHQEKVGPIKENLAKIEYEDGNLLKSMIHIVDSVFEGSCVLVRMLWC